MGSGPNYVLDKGYKATGSTAYAVGLLVTTADATGLSVVLATSPTALTEVWVCQEDLDTTRLATGKVNIDCRLLGIARVQAGGAIAVGDRLTVDSTSRAVTRARTAAGSQLLPVFGIAKTAAAAAGPMVDVMLTPGGLF